MVDKSVGILNIKEKYFEARLNALEGQVEWLKDFLFENSTPKTREILKEAFKTKEAFKRWEK